MRNFLTNAELSAALMIETDDAFRINREAFVGRKMSRCPTESGGSIASALCEGIHCQADVLRAAQRARGLQQYGYVELIPKMRFAFQPGVLPHVH